ncbi:Primase C terminal 2 (PriCT-2) [Aromatoleum tolulyticum]|uniref:Primase C terminal 2 (PriCT-2) n=1 Tax=Aromatoleum tolulyticum TaxID=34027 RepID=A0A1N6Q3Y8_9RHOO|nr:AAA family ATPase [Aromatoleum tolulyticum]SIQ11291.1 Primase C terminal 2 (PriCT-2) [Aromatoleum tolulyticum]
MSPANESALGLAGQEGAENSCTGIQTVQSVVPPPPQVNRSPLVVSLFPTITADPVECEVSDLAALAQMISQSPPRQSKSELPLLKLARFGTQRTARGSLRHDANVIEVTGIEVDYDGGQVQPEAVAQLLSVCGVEALIYSTASSTPGYPRWRALFRLSRPRRPEERATYVGKLNTILGGISAPESFTLSQAYYFGPVAGGPAPRIIPTTGAPVDIALAELPPMMPQSTPRARPATPLDWENKAPEQQAATIADLRDALRYLDPDDRASWVKTGQALCCLGDIGCELWEEWSATSTRFPGGDGLEQWGTFSGERTDYRAIFTAAEARGWANPRRRANPFTGNVAPQTTDRYQLIPADQYAMRPALPWCVKGILPAVGLGALFGPSGSGKTFLGYDLSEALERGDDWFGHKVAAPTPVTYVVQEGAAGMPKRVRANHARNGTGATAPAIVDAPFSLLDVRDWPDLASAIRNAGRAGGVVFIDTLNAAAPGADENSAEAMGRILAAVRALQAEVGGLVMLIHHPGKDVSKGMRGHSSLFAALDVVIEVTREGDQRTWRVAKSKDGQDGTAHPFRLVTVNLGTDADGDPVTSCIVESDDRPMLPRPSAKLTRAQRIAMQALREAAKTPEQLAGSTCMTATEDQWRQRAYQLGISSADSTDAKRKAFIRARDEIIDRGLVINENGNYRVAFIANIAHPDSRTDTDKTGHLSGHGPP